MHSGFTNDSFQTTTGLPVKGQWYTLFRYIWCFRAFPCIPHERFDSHRHPTRINPWSMDTSKDFTRNKAPSIGEGKLETVCSKGTYLCTSFHSRGRVTVGLWLFIRKIVPVVLFRADHIVNLPCKYILV